MLAPFSSSLERWVLRKILNTTGPAPIRLTFGDSPGVSPAGAKPVATIVIHNLKTLFNLLLDPEIGLGDGYADGGIEVQGDLVRTAEAVYRTWPAIGAGGPGRQLSSHCMKHFRPNTPPPSLRNPRRSPVRQDGPCMPQAAPSARRNGSGGRLWMGCAGTPHGAPLSRAREGVQSVA